MAYPKDFNCIKEWLLPLIEEEKLSVEQVARAAGITRVSLYNYLSDKNRPSTEVMRRICDAVKAPHEDGLSKYVPKKTGRPRGAY